MLSVIKGVSTMINKPLKRGLWPIRNKEKIHSLYNSPLSGSNDYAYNFAFFLGRSYQGQGKLFWKFQ